MNCVNLIGRLTKDPEIRQCNGELSVARYTLAVDRYSKKDNSQNADFIGCVAFGKSAEFAEKYLKKGQKVGVTGRLQSGSYINKDGKKVYTLDVIIQEQNFAGAVSFEDNQSESSDISSENDLMEDMEMPFK